VDGGLGVEEAGGFRKVFIGAAEDLAAEGGGDEVCERVSFEQCWVVRRYEVGLSVSFS
jgi:hypothetical protein